MSGDKNAVQMETTRWAIRESYVITNLSRTGQNFLNLMGGTSRCCVGHVR